MSVYDKYKSEKRSLRVSSDRELEVGEVICDLPTKFKKCLDECGESVEFDRIRRSMYVCTDAERLELLNEQLKALFLRIKIYQTVVNANIKSSNITDDDAEDNPNLTEVKISMTRT